MRAGKSLSVSSVDIRRLKAQVQDRNAPQKHVWRAEIVLLTFDGVGTNEIMRRTGKSKTCVWRWQERFIEEGFDGLLRDKTRPSRIKPLGAEAAERVVALTLGEPPGETTHWSVALMAKAAGLSVSSVQRIWRAHCLQPHRVRQFKLSNDPRFVDKLRDVVGLNVNPPAHSIVLSVDEKSQIQALKSHPARTAAEEGSRRNHDARLCATRHDDAVRRDECPRRHVIGRNMQRHRHQEFIRFLNVVEKQVPVGKTIHAIVDNYAAHKHPNVRRWLERHPRWTFHFTPTSASWLNAVEGFFATLTKRRLKRGVSPICGRSAGRH
jgi:transposase